ncbi:MAG: hypothetical protein OQK82_05695 [Candidatus Pacearchaeota archaeon]|nr:hypothetical protein [Candidatus Pacearchaeota archaeon]
MKKLTIALSLISSSCFANEKYNLPFINFAPNEYHVTSETGLNYFNQEKYIEAIQYFEKALSYELYEVPNYKIIPFLAYSYCKLGRKNEGISLLNDFQCMLELDSGKRQCYTGEIGKPGIIWHTKTIPHKCFKTMCTEEYEMYYKNNSKRYKNYYNDFQPLIDKATNECKNA